MVKNFLFATLFTLLLTVEAFAKSEWEGTWEYGRYAPAYSGTLEITDCHWEDCKFSFKTYHGSDACDVSGKIKINGTQALYYKYRQNDGNEDEQKIVMKLNPTKKTINVDWKSGYFCDTYGDINGLYENSENPLRYTTGFDCWADNLSDSEKTICASAKLAEANRELTVAYPQKVTYAWLKERNACGADEACLWAFYTKEILAEYKKAHDGEFSLYQYFQNQQPEWFFPTDYTLLWDYLENNMLKDDYAAWLLTLYDNSNTATCEGCTLMTYNITGQSSKYESAFYIDKDDIWLAFISVSLPEAQNKNIVVYGPRNKTQEDMPPEIKDWTQKFVRSHPAGILLKPLERPKLKVIQRNWYHKIKGEISVDAPEPYANTAN